MGDQHVCSFCGVAQAGKAHIKLVYENWPVEEVQTYKHRGQERERRKTVTKEVITAIGLECLNDPERWADFPIEAADVEGLFELLRLAGKNPTFLGELTPDKTLICRAVTCAQRQPVGKDPLACDHITRSSYSGTSLDMLDCWAGHPGMALVRGGRKELQPSNQPVRGGSRFATWKMFRASLYYLFRNLSWSQRLAYLAMWGVPALFVGAWWCLMVVALSPYYLKSRFRPIKF